MGKGGIFGFLRLGRKREPPISFAEFRGRIADEIRRRYPGVRVDDVGEDGLETWFPDCDEPGFLNLARNHAAYCEGRNDLAWLIEHNAKSAGTRGLEATPEALLILVRPDAFNPEPGRGGELDRGLVRPLVEGLIAIVAVDAPEAYTYAYASELRRVLKMSDAEIWQRALANTRSRIGYEAVPLEVGKIGEIVTGIGLASSLLADDEIWDGPEMTAQGPLLVAPIERDRLVISPVNDKVVANGLRNWHAGNRRNSEWLTDILIVRRLGRWELST
jgi:hypothetical protein